MNLSVERTNCRSPLSEELMPQHDQQFVFDHKTKSLKILNRRCEYRGLDATMSGSALVLSHLLGEVPQLNHRLI